MKRLRTSQGCRTLVWVLVLSGALLLQIGGPVAVAYAADELAGTWRALMKTPQGDLEIVLNLSQTEGQWSGSISDPTGSETDLTLEALSVSDNTISFNFRPPGTPFPASFFGNYLREDDVIRGTFSIAGRSSPLTRFERTSELPASLRPAEGEEPRGRQRHLHNFAVSARISYWQPIHILEDDARNMNSITTGKLNFDASARWYILDGFGVFVRYFRGGLGFDTNAYNLSLFQDRVALNNESYLKLDGFDIGFNAYVGNALFPDSRFNPYLTFIAGKTDWTLFETGRGSAVLSYDDKPFDGSAWHGGGGLGTEYELSSRLAIEAEWLWRLTFTSDENLWPDTTTLWSNTQTWCLSLGLVLQI
jgi:hypothetical protein